MEITSISEANKAESKAPIIWSIPEVIELTKLPRTLIYRALKAGDLVAHRYGRRTLIYDNDLVDFLNGLSTEKTDDLRRAVA